MLVWLCLTLKLGEEASDVLCEALRRAWGHTETVRSRPQAAERRRRPRRSGPGSVGPAPELLGWRVPRRRRAARPRRCVVDAPQPPHLAGPARRTRRRGPPQPPG